MGCPRFSELIKLPAIGPPVAGSENLGHLKKTKTIRTTNIIHPMEVKKIHGGVLPKTCIYILYIYRFVFLMEFQSSHNLGTMIL